MAEIVKTHRPQLDTYSEPEVEQNPDIWRLCRLINYDATYDKPGSRTYFVPVKPDGTGWNAGEVPPEDVLFIDESGPCLGAHGVGLRAGDTFRAIVSSVGGEVIEIFLSEPVQGGGLYSLRHSSANGTRHGQAKLVGLAAIIRHSKGPCWSHPQY